MLVEPAQLGPLRTGFSLRACLPMWDAKNMADAPVTIGGFRDEEPRAGSLADEYARAHQLIHEVHERTFAMQLANAERLSDLSIKVANSSVGLLTVFAEASASVLGKTVSGKEFSDSILDLVRKLRTEIFPNEGQKP